MDPLRSRPDTGRRFNPNIVRYDDLVPCLNAFIDTRTPGSDKKENFTIIGPGVSENPDQYVHIAQPHGFNIGGARQPPHCVNSQHSHETAEVFYVHTGTWSFNLGENGDDASVTLNPGDLISIPTHIFRGFENIGEDIGFLFAILGGDDPGKVLWAPQIFEMAKDFGLILLENGHLVDTTRGEKVPAGSSPMPVTTAEQVAKLQKFDDEQLRHCCIFSTHKPMTAKKEKVSIRNIIGRDTPLNWEHGFHLDEFMLAQQASTPDEVYDKPEVLFVHEGQLDVNVNGEVWSLLPGDTATIPCASYRSYKNGDNAQTTFIRVRGHDSQ